MADFQRLVMRAVGALNVKVYRASGGRLLGNVRGVPLLLLTVAGRNTGVQHTTAVSYLDDGGRYVVTGSAGGAASEPQWFRNLRRAEHAVIEVGSQRLDVLVKIAGPQERKALWERLVVAAPFFATYQAKVEREIPMAILTPTS